MVATAFSTVGAKASHIKVDNLIIAIAGKIEVVDPARIEDIYSAQPADWHIETLLAPRMGESTYPPLLAKNGLEAVPGNPLRFLVTLIPDLKFANGDLVTPLDVVRALNRSRNFKAVAGANVSGDKIQLDLHRPYPDFADLMSQPFTGVYKIVSGRVIGTGPAMLARAYSDAELDMTMDLEFVANPYFRLGPPQFERMTFRRYQSSQEILSRRGEWHFTMGLSPAEIHAHARTHPDYTGTLANKGTSTCEVFFNHERHDNAFRQALMAMVDADKLAVVISGDKNARGARSSIPPSLNPVFDDKYVESESAARAWLGKSQAIPKTVTIVTTWASRSYIDNPKAGAEELAASFRKLGIDVRVHMSKTRDEFKAIETSGEYDVMLAGWSMDDESKYHWLLSHYSPTMIVRPGDDNNFASNKSRCNVPEMNAALEAFKITPTQELERTINRLCREHAILVPIHHGRVTRMLQSKLIHRLPTSDIGRFDPRGLTFW